MMCRICQADMAFEGGRYLCPVCGAEFFPADYFERQYTEEEEHLWAYYRRLYCKALRDEQATARVDRRMWQLAGI